MADMNDSNSFAIESTFDTTVGNTQFLNSVFDDEPAQVSTNPEDITPIDTPAPEKKEEKPSSKKEEPKTEAPKGPSPLQSFLEDDGEDDETEDDLKDPETNKEEKEEENEEEEDATSSPFEALSRDLLKLGVFTLEEEEEEIEIKTAEDFLERFNLEKKKGASEMIDSFISQFGDDYKNAFEAIFVKGADPKEYFTTYNNIVNFAELDLTKEENQATVVRQALTDQGFDPEDISTEIERLKNYGDLESVATKHHKVLVRKEAAKLKDIEDKAEQDLKQKMLYKQQYAKNVNDILQTKLKEKEFDGIPITPKMANELQDFLLVDKWKTPSGETLTDFDRSILELKKPENHAMKIKVALLLKVLEKDPTLSTIQKTGVTKTTDKLFAEVTKNVSKKPVSQKPNSPSGFSQLL